MTPFQELRSEEVQELLTRPPKWLLRWGITIVAIILALLVGSTYLVHYPDLVHATFKLISADAPRAVVTRTDGRLMRLLIPDGQTVAAGTPLAYLESTAKQDQVLLLSHELGKVCALANKGDWEDLSQLVLSNQSQFGELQLPYQLFEQAWTEMQAYTTNGFFRKKKAILHQEIIDLQSLAKILQQQQYTEGQYFALAQADHESQRYKPDKNSGIHPEIKEEKSRNITGNQQTNLALLNNLAAQRTIQTELLDLEQQMVKERNKFLQSLTNLQTAIDSWMGKCILTAPVTGRVLYGGIWQENQAVTAGQELFNVVPSNNTYIGELYISQANIGKVAIGQPVLIKFDSYPYQEFGTVRGRITAIADITSKDNMFLAKVALPMGLSTTYNKSLVYRTGMSASADIVTADSRLIEKLFYQLRQVINSR